MLKQNAALQCGTFRCITAHQCRLNQRMQAEPLQSQVVYIYAISSGGLEVSRGFNIVMYAPSKEDERKRWSSILAERLCSQNQRLLHL